MRNLKSLKIAFIIFFILTGMGIPTGFAAIVNGGFETGDFTGWTATDSLGFNVAVVNSYEMGVDTFAPYSGTYMAMLGSDTATTNYNIFNLAMQLDPAGYAAAPVLSFAYNFWSYDYAPYDNPGFSVLVNGQTVFSIGAGDVDTDGVGEKLDYTGWQTQNISLAPYLYGLNGNVSIAFMAGDTFDRALRTGVFLDEVSMVPGAVPIPSTTLLLGSGLAGLLLFRYRSRKRLM
jgi:hypothetical protein